MEEQNNQPTPKLLLIEAGKVGKDTAREMANALADHSCPGGVIVVTPDSVGRGSPVVEELLAILEADDRRRGNIQVVGSGLFGEVEKANEPLILEITCMHREELLGDSVVMEKKEKKKKKKVVGRADKHHCRKPNSKGHAWNGGRRR